MTHSHLPAAPANASPASAALCRTVRPGTTLTLEPGIYTFDRDGTAACIYTASGIPSVEHRVSFLLENAEDITIDGQGAELIFIDSTRGERSCKRHGAVTITGNRFDSPTGHAVMASDVERLTVTDNGLTAADAILTARCGTVITECE